MRITFFGLTISSSWGNGHATPYRALIRGLHQLGHEVTFFERDVPYYARHRDFERCDYCDLVLYPSFGAVRPWALSAAASSDVVVNASYCSEGVEIAEIMLGVDGPLHVYYDLDTPVTLNKWRRGEVVEYIRPEQIGCFELALSFTGGRILRELETGYGARVARPLYGCIDPDTYYRAASRNEFACDLSYMGTYAADRQQKLEALFFGPARRMCEKKFLLAGSMYPAEMGMTRNVRRMEHVPIEEHAVLYSSSQWTLNITRAEMAEWGHCPSGRFFEAAACGTPIITDEWEGLGDFFDLDSELRVVRSAVEVMNTLEMDHREREQMARRARERTLAEHSGTVRAQQFIQACEEAASLDLERTKSVYREASL